MSFLLSPQLLAAALITGGLYACVALGLNLIYGTMRLLNVAHGEIVMIGAYAMYWLVMLTPVGPLPALLLAAGLCGLLGLALYHSLFRAVLSSPRMVERIEGNSLLLFFGLSVVLQNAMKLSFTASSRAHQPFPGLYEWGSVALVGGRLVALCVALSVCIAVALFLRFSVFGLSVRALIQSREATAIVGVNIGRLQAASFVMGFAAAGLAGALVSLFEQINPFMGIPYTISAFVVII
ncbi:MAG: branched-chain amino acid ABC transporter permease, partial [Dongiaceae bacterium]